MIITNSMEQSPCSEAYSRPASQEIPHLIWSQKIDCSVHSEHATDLSAKLIQYTPSHPS
jgi:hypothetical protein